MSRLVTNAIRSTAASSDAITIDSAGKPSFPNGGVGKILQVVSFTKTNAASASITQDTNWTGHGVAVNITPSSASNKIIISGYITVGNDRNDGIFAILYKNGSSLTSAIIYD